MDRVLKKNMVVQQLVFGLIILNITFSRGFNCKPDLKNPKIFVLVDNAYTLDYPMAKQIAGRSCRDGETPELQIIWDDSLS